LGEGHAEELIPTGKALHLVMTAIACDTPPEFMPGDKIHELSENRPASVHWPLLAPQRAEEWPYTQQAGPFKSITTKKSRILWNIYTLLSFSVSSTGQAWVKPTLYADFIPDFCVMSRFDPGR
jgi:hypothetical protein